MPGLLPEFFCDPRVAALLEAAEHGLAALP